MVSIADLLRIGQVQFGWLGYAEAIALAALVIAMVWRPCSRARWLAVPGIVFLVQQDVLALAIKPRTQMVVEGIDPGSSYLHLAYVLLELVKFAALIAVALWPMRSVPQPGAKHPMPPAGGARPV
jgi:hypothetical protein